MTSIDMHDCFFPIRARGAGGACYQHEDWKQQNQPRGTYISSQRPVPGIYAVTSQKRAICLQILALASETAEAQAGGPVGDGRASGIDWCPA